MSKLRNQWLDVAKGITIILMVLGHTTIPKLLSDFIWAFHMPLFFIASGLATDWSRWLDLPFSTFLMEKVKSLFLPFIIYSFIVLSIACPQDFMTLKGWLCYGWMGFGLWFIPVLFGGLIIVRLIMSFCNDYLILCVAVLFAILGGLLRHYDILLPWTMSSIPYAIFLLIGGSYLKKFTHVIDKPKWYILVLTVVLTLSISYCHRLDMAWNHINPIYFTTIGAFAGTLMVFTISSYLVRYTKIVAIFFSSIGRETYIILAFSQIIIMTMINCSNWNPIIRYFSLILILVLIKYLKDAVNKKAKNKIF